MTISTVGIVPGIRALAELDLNINLALSLHAPDDETRALEALQLLLRTREGVPLDAFATDDLAFMTGMLETRGDRLVLTRAGRLMANEIAIRLQIPVSRK